MFNPEGNQDSSIEINPKVGVFKFHLASYFLVQKGGWEITEILRAHGLGPYYDPIMTPLEVRQKLWDKATANEEGFFTFPPQKLILGHTLESIVVAANCSLRMRDYFVLEETGETLPLKTNLGAPLIHPGSCGPQIYEIYNKSFTPITVPIAELICPVDVFALKYPSPWRGGGNFRVQKKGKIALGEFNDSESKFLRSKILSSG